MPALNKDEKKVATAQKIYDEGVDKFLIIMEDLNDEIIEINDLLKGYAQGRPETEYQLTPARYGALKDRFNLWKANLKEPDKVLAHIENELRKKHKEKTQAKKSGVGNSGNSSSKPSVAVFSPTAK